MPIQETCLRPRNLHDRIGRMTVGQRKVLHTLPPRVHLAFNGASTLMKMPMTIMLNQTPQCPMGTRWVKVTTANKTRLACQKKSGTWHGHHTTWYPNGKKRAEGKYVNGKKHGLWKSWYTNGRLWRKGHYFNGKLHGLVSGWHINGKKKIEGKYVYGKAQGMWRWWHSNGNKSVEAKFDNGKWHGSSRRWNKQGTLIRVYNYIRGVLHGKFWRRLANGGSIEGYYRNGKKHGVLITKDQSGKVIQRCTVEVCRQLALQQALVAAVRKVKRFRSYSDQRAKLVLKYSWGMLKIMRVVPHILRVFRRFKLSTAPKAADAKLREVLNNWKNRVPARPITARVRPRRRPVYNQLKIQAALIRAVKKVLRFKKYSDARAKGVLKYSWGMLKIMKVTPHILRVFRRFGLPTSPDAAETKLKEILAKWK